jgi:hypothetical protein
MRGEGRERAGGRVAIRVVGADRDHGESGSDAFEQRPEPSIVGTVVGDLEDVDRPRFEWRRFGLRVGGQEHREVVPTSADDERKLVRVGVGRRFDETVGRRPEHFEPQRARAKRRSRRDLIGCRALVTSIREVFAVEPPVDEPPDRNPPERFRDPRRVIGLVVGDDRRSEPIDPLVMQLRNEFVPRRPAVDQHRGRAPRLQQDRIPLADIENLDPQPRHWPARRPRATRPRGDQDNRRDSREPHAECDPLQPSAPAWSTFGPHRETWSSFGPSGGPYVDRIRPTGPRVDRGDRRLVVRSTCVTRGGPRST